MKSQQEVSYYLLAEVLAKILINKYNAWIIIYFSNLIHRKLVYFKTIIAIIILLIKIRRHFQKCKKCLRFDNGRIKEFLFDREYE